MSMTKSLRKQLKTMTPEAIVAERDRLTRALAVERNSCVKSSIIERLRMCERAMVAV